MIKGVRHDNPTVCVPSEVGEQLHWLLLHPCDQICDRSNLRKGRGVIRAHGLAGPSWRGGMVVGTVPSLVQERGAWLVHISVDQESES